MKGTGGNLGEHLDNEGSPSWRPHRKNMVLILVMLRKGEEAS